ncbi:glycerate kinase [Bacillus sp. SD088]|uniref:glycerate kinase n=1 Tax=Bacillus sp. SD088 TaxID=2782012 RepID=UPI001A95B40A|nr:glycerate kinase [Bacillus sp. SD088]MBO0995724.1 glycerate kinase [Bacillus sp. SD088]
MKILLSPDSFKESLSASRVAQIMSKAIISVDPDIKVDLLPVADGGEGTLEVLNYALAGEVFYKQVTGPLGEKVLARYAIFSDQKTAIVEMAEASGIHLVSAEKRNPMRTTSYGTGELILAALEHEITNLIITIGGSATNDGGVGMLQAIGAEIVDQSGRQVDHGGGSLGEISSVHLASIDPRLKGINISVACDVTNPLCGENGASYIYGPQKGATNAMIKQLDQNLNHFNHLLEKTVQMPIGDVQGSGAAGGLGAALLAIGGKLQSGIDLVLETLDFSKALDQVDFVFTGEGKIDHQTPNGKVIAGIVREANIHHVPVVAFAGSVQEGYEPLFKKGLLSVHSIINNPCDLEEAFIKAEENLFQTVENVVRLINFN